MPTALRPLVPEDRQAFQEFVRGLSAQARLNRFLAPIRELSPAALDALTRADQARHVALVATENGRIVGEARYVALGESGHAEFAVAVADEAQRHGIGARLLGALVRMARQAGLQVLEGEVLRTNAAMLRFLRRAGFRMSVCAGDARLARVERILSGA
ncbi:MAG TPA: GNAT family N-acetyltransferase [Burkholderiales bacterium]